MMRALWEMEMLGKDDGEILRSTEDLLGGF
jgi:hypothetical protein